MVMVKSCGDNPGATRGVLVMMVVVHGSDRDDSEECDRRVGGLV